MIAGNKAILELKRNGGGPAHINLITAYGYSETTALNHKELPLVRKIDRFENDDLLPSLPKGKIGIFVGNHRAWSRELLEVVNKFCMCHNAVVFCDHTSNYNGPYKNLFPLAINQAPLNNNNTPAYTLELCIHIGEVSGEEGAPRMIKSKETWRVSEDGEIRDYLRNLTKVFEMSEFAFFSQYISCAEEKENTFINEIMVQNNILHKVVDTQLDMMPFSNVWIAQKTASLIPSNSTITLSILNTLRTWNYAEFPQNVNVICPTGGFGIDGIPSIALGASLSNPDKLSFCIVGDLAFFYDMNSIGNRHVGKNLRLLIVNNGCGVEFKKTYAMSYRLLGEDVDPYVAAKGHFGHKSRNLVRHYAEDLGFEYITASNKEEFLSNITHFTKESFNTPIVFEVFVNDSDEAKALNIIHNRE
jgi:2-succinyl-5-enolpyruvyl-6-hydroxy-3-cyclohexene-1-carboxylate synthase